LSVKRLVTLDRVPVEIKRAFCKSPDPFITYGYRAIWKEIAARAVLDALGYTGLTDEPGLHDRVITEARNWFKFDPYSRDVFLLAEIELDEVRPHVLATPAKYSESEEDLKDVFK
jgi:hypothetical protein